ncbi:MAG TPA: branched-chain amino acid ABC transporter permease [Phototrophicaceae bacterium]|nr:branched-chain amino acid ABC transporter permease [Phototrophicaceae bacterium]
MTFFQHIGISETVFQFMLVDAILGLSMFLPLYTGMFSLANAGFMAIGAYVGVLMTQQAGLPLGVALIGAMLVAGLIAIPIGLPVLRLRDLYLAIATIGFGEIVNIVLLNFDALAGGIRQALTGDTTPFVLLKGARGITGIPKLATTAELLVFLIVASYFVIRLHRSRFGRAMSAIRQDERAAENMGINTVYVKNAVFVMSAMLAAAGGVFSGHLTRIVTPDLATFDQAVDILAYAVLGGTTVFIGPVVGGLVLGALPEVLRFLQQYRGVFDGLVLLIVIVYLPGGLINPAGWTRLWRRLRPEKSQPSESGVT